MPKVPIFKKVLIAVWALFIVFCLVFFLTHKESFTPEGLAQFCAQFRGHILGAYLVICLLRGFTLIPSTPFVLAGTILYPADPLWILAISMIGIVFSSSMIYFFSEHMGFVEYFERKHPARIARLHEELQKPAGLLFVFLWSLFPLVPTDAVCYVAGILKMNFLRFIVALVLGELILCCIYIFFYSYIAGLFLSVI